MSIVFFHQNEAVGSQGGIERYLSTLLELAGPTSLLVTGAYSGNELVSPQSRIRVHLPFRRRVPKWLSYVLGVALAARQISRAIQHLGPCTLEFSRPEYVLFSWMFRGAKVFTLHGTGPARAEGIKYWLHRISCLMLPAVADAVQIVGRDPSALTPSVLAHLSTRVRYIDAWYDDTFCVSPFRNLDGPLRIFYAGRLAPMKNPELLLKVIETSQRVCGDSVEFRYFGADAAKIPDRFKEQFPSFGLLSAPELAEAISDCHVGILCSGFGEGSPFIVVEALACGRGFILPPLAGLLDSYRNHRGVMFAPDYSVDAFLDTLTRMQTEIRNGLTPEIIASDVRDRSKAIVVREILQGLEADHG